MERSKLTWAFKTLMDHETLVAFGTDYPVVEINPMNGVYRAVTRLHEDKEPIGGLEVGKYADIVVLENRSFQKSGILLTLLTT